MHDWMVATVPEVVPSGTTWKLVGQCVCGFGNLHTPRACGGDFAVFFIIQELVKVVNCYSGCSEGSYPYTHYDRQPV
jgi:hypothetical protein